MQKFLTILGCLVFSHLSTGHAQPNNNNRQQLSNKAPSEWIATGTSTNILTDIDKIRLINIQGVLNAYASLKMFSGVVVVAKNGEPIYKYINSFANLDYNIPNSLECKYNTLNITHSFTAIAIMQLVESGQINLFTPIKSYLPELPAEIGNALNVHNLLSHTSGLMDYYQIPEYRENFLKINQLSDLVKLISTQDRPCNTSIQQATNSGYILLGAIIERLTGMSYADYIRQNILKPADMQNSDLYYWHEVVTNKAIGYLPDHRNELIAAPDFIGAYPFGADGIYANADDLIKFTNALHSGKILSLEAQKVLYQDYSLRDNPNDSIAQQINYGWKTKQVLGNKVIYQGSSIGGLSTQLRRYNNDEYVVAVLCNYYDNTAELIADKLERAILYENYFVPKDPVAYLINEYIVDKGINYVAENADTFLVNKNIKLEYVWSLYSLGYDLLNRNKYAEAEEVFKLNSRKFANEPVVYDSLGDFYFQTKKFDLAKHYFGMKLQVAPNDQRAKNMIKESEAALKKIAAKSQSMQ